MKRCMHVRPNGRRCWAVAPAESSYCDLHAPKSAEHSLGAGLEGIVDRYNAIGSFIDNYWAGDQLRVDDFLEAVEIAMALAEDLGAGREVH